MTVIEVAATTTAPREAVWQPFADPDEWSRWAPHIRRVEAQPGTVRVGDTVAIHGFPVPVRVRASIVRVDPGHRWDFEVDPLPGISLYGVHLVEDDAASGGRRVVVILAARGPLRRLTGLLLRAYWPLAAVAVRRLARLADDEAAATRS